MNLLLLLCSPVSYTKSPIVAAVVPWVAVSILLATAIALPSPRRFVSLCYIVNAWALFTKNLTALAANWGRPD